MWKEFKEFAFKGNVMDMAIGVIIGGAFGKIVTSIVNDLVMPAIGYLLAGISFKDLKIVLSPAVLNEAGEVMTPETAIMYGNFIQQCVDFFIIALCIFFAVKFINKATTMAKKKEEEPAEEPAPEAPAAPTEAELLAEIRDLLAAKNEGVKKDA